MSLGDLFPDEFRKEFAERSIERGAVIITLVPDTKPPKVKFFVVLGASKDQIYFGLVFINSRINPHIFKNPMIRSCHIPLLATEYDFLQHDSFVDCTQIYEKGITELRKTVTDRPEIIVGKISASDMDTIKIAIKNATTIATGKKRNFGLA